MKSLRLQTIASFIEQKDRVADIGCDHAYLSIFLTKNKLCEKVIATDINENALQFAKDNIKKNKLENKIKTYLSDGLQNVNDKDLNTIVISGMGANTILHIIENINETFTIKKFIIQSNNDLPKIRTTLRKKKIYLQKEKVIYEKKHYYTIGIYTKEYASLKKHEKWFGKYDSSNSNYYQFLKQELITINQKLKGKKNISKKWIIFLKRLALKKYL